MDAKSYCDSVRIELTQWKAKLYDVIRKTESLPADQKTRITPSVEELNTIVVFLFLAFSIFGCCNLKLFE